MATAKRIQLQPREKRVIIIGVVCLALIAAFQLSRTPWRAYQASFNELEATEARLDQARLWFQFVSGAQAEQGALVELINDRQGYTSLRAYIDAAVREHDLVRRSSYESRELPANPSMESVTVSLRGVSMAELLDFLHGLYERNPLLVMDSMSRLGPNPSQQGLDCEMTFLSPRQPSRS
jgi:type II secretory pathway component PulM